jgi:hypothetical protein
MKTKVLVVGALGNMGKRYCSILSYLNIPFVEVDIGTKRFDPSCTHIILATPTSTHLDLIDQYSLMDSPILCEKPIITDINEFERLESILELNENVFMVNQYAYDNFSGAETVGKTVYNYYKHGSDGKYWDCIQAIYLANGEVEISESSPVWRCIINGTGLSLSNMDYNYIKMIQDFLGKQENLWGKEAILKAHRKVITCLVG